MGLYFETTEHEHFRQPLYKENFHNKLSQNYIPFARANKLVKFN